MGLEDSVRYDDRRETIDDLDVLLASGRFGKTRAEVAEQLIREKVRDLILQGWMGPDAIGSPTRRTTGQGTSRPGSSNPRGDKPRRGSR